MIRWLRIATVGLVILTMIGLGAGLGLVLVENSGDVVVRLHPWLRTLFGGWEVVVWLPGLIAGWLIAVFVTGSLILWSMYYVWRRRQYESLIGRLERELVELRNLPFTRPAPFEDLPEAPDPEARRILARMESDDHPGRALTARGESARR